ncbi:STAS domain-containing protein [Streptomyces sp. NPDC049813]|uniref:STAS domain-containing protein n=1 Tax=Streptomyces sp. NPDC049813 TaxID=3365597 RepID=UPI0037A82EE7
MFSVEVNPDARASVLVLRGDLDLDSAVQLREAATTLFAGPELPRVVVVDCAQLSFCDSTGINCLVVIYQRLLAYGGLLRLTAVPGSVARTLRQTGLDQVITVHETVQEALDAGDGVPGAVGGTVSAARADHERQLGDDARSRAAAAPGGATRRRSDA